MKRTLVAAALAASVITPLAPMATSVRAEDPKPPTLVGCKATVQFFSAEPERMQRYLPTPEDESGFPKLRNPAYGYLDTQACNDVVVDGKATGQTMFTVVGVEIEKPVFKGTEDPPMLGGENHDLYAVAIHSNNTAFVNRLKQLGMPAHHVQGMGRDVTSTAVDYTMRLSIPWAPSPYQITGTFTPQGTLRHNHNLSYWHRRGGDVFELEVLQHDADGRQCVPPSWFSPPLGGECGEVRAESGFMREFLGDQPSRPLGGFDHPGDTHGYWTVVSVQ